MEAEVVAAVAILGVVVLAHLMVLLPELPRSACACAKMIRQTCQCAFTESTESTDGQTDEQHDRMLSLLISRLVDVRVQNVSAILRMWMNLSTVVAFATLYRLATGVMVVHVLWNACTLAFLYIPALVVRMFPAVLNKKTLWVFHSLGMFAWVWVGVYVTADVRQHLRPPLLLARVTFGLAYPKPWPNLIWNSVFTTGGIVRLLAFCSTCSDMPTSTIILGEVLEVAMLSAVLRVVESLQISQIRSDLEANGYMRAKTAMGSLLSDMCDAVVELGPSLSIKQPSPKLVDVLLREPMTTAMKGEAFPNIIFNETDRENFRTFVAQRSVPVEDLPNNSRDGRPSSMYLSLRAAHGIRVHVQLFHSCHHGTPGDVCHIVGVREVDREVAAADDAANGNGNANANADALAKLPQIERQNERLNDDVESTASVTSGSVRTASCMALAPLIPEQNELAPVSVLVDPMEMRIAAGTIGLRALLGPIVSKGKMSDVVINYRDFETWLQETVNRFLADEELYAFEVQVAPPLARKQASFEFKAIAYVIRVQENVKLCEIGVEQADGEAEEEEHRLLCLVELTDAEPHWKDPKKKPRKREAMVEPWPSREATAEPLPHPQSVSL